MGSTEEEVQVAARLFLSAHDGPTDQFRDEMPTQEVDLPGFWIDKTEVPNAAFARCVEAGPCSPPSNERYLSQSNYWDPAFALLPVITNWQQATAFCHWAAGRLPTEAEWEKAARGPYGWQFPWGDAGPTCDVAIHLACGGSLQPVGERPLGASPYGALDMAGNAGEWVSSLYVPYPYDGEDGREDPTAQGSRVVRSPASSWDYLRITARIRDDNDYGAGFRCVNDVIQ
jgi:formylglycine-generating enzyme required for sulfatase activity